MAETHQLLGKILVDLGVIGMGQVQAALSEQRRMGGRIGEILLKKESITSEDLSRALAIQQGLEWIPASELNPDEDAISLLDGGTARAFGALPLQQTGDVLRVAIADPDTLPLLSDLESISGCRVEPVLSAPDALAEAVENAYRKVAEAKAAAEVEASEAAPIVRLLESILTRAVRDRAADVHFEPYQGSFRIRMRSDGVLYEIDPPPAHLAVSIVSRIKVLADLDISETRMPQDGRIELILDNHKIDFRVSTVPTAGGESVVLRLLDRRNLQLDLSILGLTESEDMQLRDFIGRPHGIVLVTGPTGSGKTTTLYSLLSQVNDTETKVLTVEDPVEYDLDGVVQIPVNDEIGVNYARILRTMLRQDPDIIMIGEIRDPETAQIAVEAALTGHLVLSTLHTNDAPSTVTRMVDLGVEPFLLAATMEGIVAQRLVRKVCTQCTEAYLPEPEVREQLGLASDEQFQRGSGCDNCHFTGYSGRTAIYEVLPLDAGIKEAFLQNPSTLVLRDEARKRKMQTLRERGLALAREGKTTPEEVLHGTQGEE